MLFCLGKKYAERDQNPFLWIPLLRPKDGVAHVRTLCDCAYHLPANYPGVLILSHLKKKRRLLFPTKQFIGVELEFSGKDKYSIEL